MPRVFVGAFLASWREPRIALPRCSASRTRTAAVGSGTLTFHGRRYPLSIGGLSAGLVFGASQTYLSGTVSNIRRPSDVAGVYGAAGAGAAVGRGVNAIVLSNEKGAVLTMQGRQTGLMVNADLSGLAISLR